ncbi:MAG: hypothetical protein GY804_05060 [Alphaproteobacteria bacterium]|nr:hypothetical protein [Alphaproteobacteria bacterium]
MFRDNFYEFFKRFSNKMDAYEAFSNNNYWKLKSIADNDPELFSSIIKEQGEDKETLVHIAIREKKNEALKIMAEKAPEAFIATLTIPNIEKDTPVLIAIKEENVEALVIIENAISAFTEKYDTPEAVETLKEFPNGIEAVKMLGENLKKLTEDCKNAMQTEEADKILAGIAETFSAIQQKQL